MYDTIELDQLNLATMQQHLVTATPEWARTNRAFFDGDHWQGGAGWIGPMLEPGDPEAPRVLAEIQRGFVSANKVKEVVARHVGAVIGHEPTWGLTVRRPLKPGKKPTAAEQALIDEAEAVLTEWWDERGLHRLFQEVVTTLLLASRATMRLYIPVGERDAATGEISAADLRTSLFRLHVEQPALGAATVVRDRSTMRQVGLYAASEDNKPYGEVSYVEGGETLLRVFDGASEPADYRYPLAGHLFIHELRRDVLVTEQVRQLQKLLNLARTMEARNVNLGGFLERVILNAQLPGRWEADATAPGGKRFIPDKKPLKLGAGRTSVLNGLPIFDEKGKVSGYTSPSVNYRDPVSVETFEATMASAYGAILEETHQLHARLSGDAAASGESRRQALADFLADLTLTAPHVQKAGRWLIEASLALAAKLAGQPNRYAALRATFECRIDVGPVSADDLRLTIELVAAKLLSRETGMARIGVEDVGAELGRIAAEAAAAQAAAQAAGLPAPGQQTNDPQRDGQGDPAQGGQQPGQQRDPQNPQRPAGQGPDNDPGRS